MDYRDNEQEAEFRAALRQWLASSRPQVTQAAEEDLGFYDNAWHRKLFEGGWLGLTWPTEYGGRGLPPIFDAILNEEVGLAGAPQVPGIGYLSRAILNFGDDAQRQRFLPGMLAGTVRWCQGFSEPGAGSDLASLRTRATLGSSGYSLTGQKIWTSRANEADRCLVLARTDPSLPKHRGISCFVLELKQPGVTVRPIRQITGSMIFNEVFFDGAHVPLENRIGEEGQGWNIAMRTLAYERGPSDSGFISRYHRALQGLEQTYQDRGAKSEDDHEIGRLHVLIECLRLKVMESLSARAQGAPAGSESSIDKLLMAGVEQSLGKAFLDAYGSGAVLGDQPNALFRYLLSRAVSIAGGTSQIQKSIVATRVLHIGE